MFKKLNATTIRRKHKDIYFNLSLKNVIIFFMLCPVSSN